MSFTSVPVSGGTEAEQCGEPVAELLDSALSSGDELPCRRDPDLWFAETPTELDRAKALCADCPIKVECLAGALSRGEPWGVWGGEIFERGAVIARKRARGRPRKNPQNSGAVREGQERVA
ncbi:WhiB family redox-sensing transcriptional regulator [Saccharopolyspora lacisalsi]|uniref:Transcriptional regulator WhiB n=1 Tax=Halosaccharopolyspora lacisalsi TaxID=1000566 RepID=A0A839DPN9_9PSEU|nr:WhiB family transcriptional regulator [Halosaccharopolyspora lacisalsi]MBA8823023.1 WhiB family redox-sensing transcriptional regulator [Halosaccharopolyspora lacisalsi]